MSTNTEYHKIRTLYLRDPDNNYRTLLEGEFARPEFDYLSHLNWVWTEKVDGTNIRAVVSANGVEFRGRTDKAQIPGPLLEHLISTLPTKVVMGLLDGMTLDGIDWPFFTLFGEGYGPKIQGGEDYRPRAGFILFDVLVGHRRWLSRHQVEIVAARLGLPCVPVVGVGNLSDMAESVKARLPSAVATGKRLSEGIVARPFLEMNDRRGRRIITKLKVKDFPSPKDTGGK